MTQKNLRLEVPALPGESQTNHRFRLKLINGGESLTKSVSPQKLLCDLLKRQCRVVMGDITECPSESIPAHLARLLDLQEVIDLATRHEFVPGNETRLSGAQLRYPQTLADLRACLDLTRRNHRAPVFVNQRDSELAQINQKIDLLAGLVAQAVSVSVPEIFTNQEGENER